MVKYKKIYMDAFGYVQGDFIPSELSHNPAVDIHHIISRGKGGKDRIENLMALTREEHLEFGDNKHWMFFLLNKHYEFLTKKGVEFSKDYFQQLWDKYRLDAY